MGMQAKRSIGKILSDAYWAVHRGTTAIAIREEMQERGLPDPTYYLYSRATAHRIRISKRKP